MSGGYYTTARAYIVYREKRSAVRATGAVVVDVANTINGIWKQSDWRVNENANQGYSLGVDDSQFRGQADCELLAQFGVPQEIRDAHVEGDFHIHDLSMFAGYCAGWVFVSSWRRASTAFPGKVASAPPKHLETAVAQMVNFLGTLQNEWAGAQAFSSFDTYLAPFIRKDSMGYEAVKQCVQQFVFNLNVPSRWGTQTPFTNITLDWVCPEDMRDKHPIIGGAVRSSHMASARRRWT